MIELFPTPGATWRQPRLEGYVVNLPSGNFARLRPVAIDILIANGKIPDLLTPIAARSLWEETATDQIANQAEMAKGFADLVNIIVPAAMMQPRIVDNPQGDDEISLDDLDFGDKLAIFQLATGGSATLKAFCKQQAANLAALLNSEGDGKPAQPVDRPA